MEIMKKVPMHLPVCKEYMEKVTIESMSTDRPGCRENLKASIDTPQLAAGKTRIMCLWMDRSVGKTWTRCL